jgi:hypothetical protein
VGIVVAFVVIWLIPDTPQDTGDILRAQQAAQAQRRKATVVVACQATLKRRLYSPRSAEFPWDALLHVRTAGPKTYQLASYVDADNAFGGNIRTHFFCEVTEREEQFFVTTLTVDQ